MSRSRRNYILQKAITRILTQIKVLVSLLSKLYLELLGSNTLKS
jgi:hypothetical protein